MKKPFFNMSYFSKATTTQDLRYNKSIISDLLLKVLRETIPPAEVFNKLSRGEQREINNKLQEIFGTEKTFKTLVSLEHRSEYIGVQLQQEEYKKFDSEFSALMLSKNPEQPEKKEALIYHLSKAVHITKEKLSKSCKKLKFDTDDVKIARSIDPRALFACFLSSTLGKAYKSFVTSKNKESQVHERGLSLKKIDVVNYIQLEILGHITCAVLRHATSSVDGSDLSEEMLNRQFSRQFKNHTRTDALPYAQKEVSVATDILFHVLEKDNFLSDHYVTYDSSQKKNFRYYDLNPKLDPIVSLTAQVPDLVKPLIPNENDISVRDIFAGANEFKASKKLRKALDIANKTPYVVDEEGLELFKKERASEQPKTYKLPFPTSCEEREDKAEENRRLNYIYVSPERYHFYRYITEIEHDRLKNKPKNEESLKRGGKLEKDRSRAEILSKTLLTNLEITHHKFCSKAKKKLQVNRQKLLSFETMIVFAEFFKGYTLYYPKFFDYRGRQLPKAWFASNTLGDLRYLIKIKDHYTINLIGLEEVFKAIYSNTVYTKKAAEYLRNVQRSVLGKKAFFQTLMLFVNENTLTPTCYQKNYVYKTLLIKKFKALADNKFKTWIYVERDQKSSSSVFMSILLRNEELASKSNLTGESSDVIGFLQDNFKKYYISKIQNGDKILSLFEKDRNLLKKGFMFLSYGQKNTGRINDFKKILANEHGISMNRTNYQIIRKISDSFEDFLNENINNFCRQLEILDQIFSFLIKANNKYSTVTLDGALLSWVAFEKPTTKVLTYYSPVTKSKRSFRQPENSKKNIDLRRNLRGCKANLIHSFDGAIIREFSRRFKEEGYNILTIHDCVQYNPNAALLFERIVLDIYVNNDIAKDFFNSAFEHPRKYLQEDSLDAFDRLIEKLYKTSTLKHISELNYENLYELE